MDNPSESTALNLDSAATAFAEILEPKREEGEQPEAETPELEEEAPEEQPEPEAETTEDDPLVKIKVNGEEIEVPLSELKNGYQRQADYTRKTMEVAEQRKQAEAEAQKATQERTQYQQNLQRMQAQLEVALQEHQSLDWEQLIQTDPQEYLRQKHLFEQRQAAWQQNQQEQYRLSQIEQAQEIQRRQDYIKHQQAELLAKLPEWSDPKKAQAESAAIRSYLLEQGYTADVVDNLAEANMVVTARKAMLYDQMIAKAQATQKKVAALPTKVEKPGTGANPGLDRRTSAYQKLSKSGRVEDAASVFASFL